MADIFDPYYKWLAIPPKDQPPNYYRLLGVELFEQDLDVISSAADQRMAHVRSFQAGQNSALSQKILNELAAARVCLLNPQKKARYDAELRGEADDLPQGEADDDLPESEPAPIEASAEPMPERRRRANFPVLLLAAGIGLIAVMFAGVLAIVLRRDNDNAAAINARAPDDSSSSKGEKNGADRSHTAIKLPADDDRFVNVVLSPSVTMRLVRIEGSTDGRVRPFYLGQTEVTEGEWDAVMGGASTSRLPRVAITFGDCREYCRMLNLLPSAAGSRLRLPTRDELIHALGDLSDYDLGAAWCRENSPEQVREVAAKKANRHGLFDLLGNVWEFAADGRFYGMSNWDNLERRYLAYSSIPLPLNWSGTTVDWKAGNLGFRVAASEAIDRTTGTLTSRRAGTRHARESADDDPATVLERIFTAPLAPPDAPGVTADQIVIWNQHHGAANDRGTLEYNLRLFSRAGEVWSHEGAILQWSPDRDMLELEAPPPVRFDRLRVEVTDYQSEGGGLAEIEVFRGPRNLARGCPVAGPLTDALFPATAVTDGMIGESTAQRDGYWLLLPKVPGWVEVDLAFAEPRTCDGIRADRVVVWNQHNGASADRGTTSFHLALVSNGREVWRRENIKLDWHADQIDKSEVDLPDLAFDRVRVEVASWQGIGGGLGEVEVWRNGQNVALGCPVVASGSHIERCRAQNVTDEGSGYWLLSDGQTGWVEIDLSPNDPQVGEANGRLGAYRCVIEDDWAFGLPWLARSNDAELRRLALDDLADPIDAGDQAVVADRWWEIAQQLSGESRQRLLARALFRYAQATAQLSDEERRRLRTRLDDALAELPEREYLYFREDESQGIEGGLLRHNPVVVDGIPSPYGLLMHPPDRGAARTQFALAGKYHRFHGAVALNDTAYEPASPVVFQISGDGRTLWTSQPLSERGTSEPFDIDISGIALLELSTHVPGPANWCHAVWLAPRVEE